MIYELDFQRSPDRLTFKLMGDLDKALAEMKRERAYRAVNMGEDNYPLDRRVPGEITDKVVAAKAGAGYCNRTSQHYAKLAALYAERAEYLEAMDYLFQRELTHYFNGPRR